MDSQYQRLPLEERNRDEDGSEISEEQALITSNDDHVSTSNSHDERSKRSDDEKKAAIELLRLSCISLAEKKFSLRELKEYKNGGGFKKKAVSPFRVWLSWSTVRLKRLHRQTKDAVTTWGLWKGHLKNIGGHFGNGVLSYFTFLRWLFLLNTCIGILTFVFISIPHVTFKKLTCMQPTVNGTVHFWTYPSNQSAGNGNSTVQFYNSFNCLMEYAKVAKEHSVNKNTMQNVIDLFQGTGWMNLTVMFYGSYDNAFYQGFDGWIYNMPLAYILTSFVCLMLSLYLIVSSAIKTFEQSHVKGGRRNEYSFSNKIFGGWDMCIMSEETAQLTSISIVRELEADVIEALRHTKEEEMTKRQEYCLKTIRFLVNSIILMLLFFGALAIYHSTVWSIQEANTDEKQTVKSMLRNYASQITITLVNVLLPNVFYRLSNLEDYDQKTKINVDLIRTVMVKLASICVLLATVYRKISIEKTLCWENVLGAEMYKLIWTNFVVLIAVTILVEYPRSYIGRNVDLGCNLKDKVGVPEFQIPDNVLELVYGQTIIWVGTIFCPLLPMMGSLTLFAVFHLKRISLMHNFDPPKKPYRAGKSNYFFMVLQLLSFALSLVATIYAVTQVTPSPEHGPFRGFRRMYDIFALTIADFPSLYRYIFYLIFSPVIGISVVLVLCLALYFYWSMCIMYSRKSKELELQLAMEQKDRRRLLKDLAIGDKKDFEKEASIEIQESDVQERHENADDIMDNIVEFGREASIEIHELEEQVKERMKSKNEDDKRT